MKKQIVKFLKFLLKKLTTPTHYEYKMSAKELERVNIESYVNQLHSYKKDVSEEKIEDTPDRLYVYQESNFSVKMKNIPERLIQSYNFVNKNQVEFEIILGVEGDIDVYKEIEVKSFNSMLDDEKNKENVEIEIYSKEGCHRKIVLENIKVVKYKAFEHGSYDSNKLSKAVVNIKYETKKVSKF